eukprot:11479667-Alexandrium_andersonii.AAC.1
MPIDESSSPALAGPFASHTPATKALAHRSVAFRQHFPRQALLLLHGDGQVLAHVVLHASSRMI